MTESIIVALISGSLAFLATLISNLTTSSKTLYRIEQLEKKVEKHNNIVERVFKLEQKVEDLEKGGAKK